VGLVSERWQTADKQDFPGLFTQNNPFGQHTLYAVSEKSAESVLPARISMGSGSGTALMFFLICSLKPWSPRPRRYIWMTIYCKSIEITLCRCIVSANVCRYILAILGAPPTSAPSRWVDEFSALPGLFLMTDVRCKWDIGWKAVLPDNLKLMNVAYLLITILQNCFVCIFSISELHQFAFDLG